jgi:predicted DNA-binding antitoxin AbrB/MazE fold protein
VIPRRKHALIRTLMAKFTNGALIPLQPLDAQEGEELLITVADATDLELVEDIGMARAIDEGLETESVSEESILNILRSPDEA